MAPEDMSLPVIDISPYLAAEGDSKGRVETSRALNKACVDTGFFYLTGHGITKSTTDLVLDLARRFFIESSDAEKAAIQRKDAGVDNGDGGRGYQKIGENVTKGRQDWHEAVDCYAELDGPSEPPYRILRGKNLWPSHPDQLQSVYEEYIEDVKRVGAAVVHAMGDALGLKDVSGDEGPDVFVKATDKSFWVLRMIGYPGLPGTNGTQELNGDAEQFSCGEHTDYGAITILLADATPNALQVQSKTGEWITANPRPGAFVVNIGDMMQRWTNDLWKSTNHRVIHRGENFRVSVPFFFEPSREAVVKPLRACVDRTGGKALYEPVAYGPYLENKIANNFY